MGRPGDGEHGEQAIRDGFGLTFGQSITKVSLMKSELVTTLKREATRLIAKIRKAKSPVLITQHGRPAAYLVDAESFEALQERLRILEGIARGERALQEGRGVPHREAKRRMARWLT